VVDIEPFVLAAYLLHEEAIAEGERILQPGSFARVRYEDLVKNPIKEMTRLYDELNLGDFEAVRPLIERHLVSVAGHTRNSFRLTGAQRQRIEEAWGRTIVSKGYNWPEDQVTLAS
jgi:hypothetical protein